MNGDDVAPAAIAMEHVQRAVSFAAALNIEHHAADQQPAALELAADQGVALRGVIAHTGAGVVSALLEVASAVYDVANALREARL